MGETRLPTKPRASPGGKPVQTRRTSRAARPLVVLSINELYRRYVGDPKEVDGLSVEPEPHRDTE